MEKLPYYKRLILTREYILRSEMLPIDPTCVDRATDRAVDHSEGCWSEYYAIYIVDSYGDIELWEDYLKFEDASKSFIMSLYELYVEDFDPAEGEPVSYDEWKQNDLPTILDELFPSRKDDKGKEF